MSAPLSPGMRWRSALKSGDWKLDTDAVAEESAGSGGEV